MASKPKSLVDICFILFSIVAVGLIGVLVLKNPQQVPEEPVGILDSAEQSENRQQKPTWNYADALNLNHEEMLRELKAAHNFEDPQKMDFLCDGVRRQMGVADDGAFLPAEQFEGREAARLKKADLLNRLVEHRLAISTLDDVQKKSIQDVTSLRHLRLEKLTDSILPEIDVNELCKAEVKQLLDNGTTDSYVQYLDLLLNRTTTRACLDAAVALSDSCVENNVSPLIQFDVADLCLIVFHDLYKSQPVDVDPEEYIKVVNRLRDTSARLIKNHDEVDWTPQECWRFFASRMDSAYARERAYILMPLATGSVKNEYLRHMVFGLCLQNLADEFSSKADDASEFAETIYSSMLESAVLSTMHFQNAWLLQPEDANAPFHQIKNFDYGTTGCFSPEVWLALVTFTDYDHQTAYWQYSKHLGYQEALDFAEKCVTTGSPGSDLPVHGLSAIERYNSQCWPAQIYRDPQVPEIAAKCARNLIAYLKTDKARSEPEFMHRHARHFAGSMLVMGKRFEAAAELAMSVPDAKSLHWFQPRYTDPTFGTYLFTCLGSEVGHELAEIETLIHSDPFKLDVSHLAVVEQLLKVADQETHRYLENRLSQIQLSIALQNGLPYQLSSSDGYVWETSACEIERLDDTSINVGQTKGSAAFIVMGLRMPAAYSMTADLAFSEPRPNSRFYFKPRNHFPEDLGTNRGSSEMVDFRLPIDQQQMQVEINVDGTDISVRVNGQEIPPEQSGQIRDVNDAGLGIPVWLNSDVPFVLSNVTIHAAN